MAKLSDIFLNSLGNFLLGAGGVNVDQYRRDQQKQGLLEKENDRQQQELELRRLSTLSDFGKNFDISQNASEGSFPVNLPGIGPTNAKARPSMFQTFVQGPDGNLVPGQVVKGAPGTKPVIGRAPLATSQKDERNRQLAAAKVKEKALKELDDLEGGQQQISSLFDKRKSLVKEGKAGNPLLGLGFGALSKITGGGLGTGDIKAFNDIRRGLVARLKRVTGDTGVLTETDAQRLIGLLSSLSEGDEAAQSKMSEILSVFNEAKRRQGAKTTQLLSDIQSGNEVTFDPNVFSSGSQSTFKDPPTLGKRIRVKNKQTGKTGTISDVYFDPQKYEMVP